MTAPTVPLRTPPDSARLAPGWFTAADCRLEDFRPLVEQATRLDDYPHAEAVEQNVLIYGERVRGPAEADGADGADRTASAFGRQAQLLSQALEEDWDVSRLRAELAAQRERSRA